MVGSLVLDSGHSLTLISYCTNSLYIHSWLSKNKYTNKC